MLIALLITYLVRGEKQGLPSWLKFVRFKIK